MFFCLICWRSKLQTVTAQSTHETELIAVALASNELIWIRKFMNEIGFAVGACSPIARPVITGVDSDLPEIDSTTTDFALEVAKEDADDAIYGEKFAIEPLIFSTTTRAQHRRLTIPSPTPTPSMSPPKSFALGSTLLNVYSEFAIFTLI